MFIVIPLPVLYVLPPSYPILSLIVEFIIVKFLSDVTVPQRARLFWKVLFIIVAVPLLYNPAP